MKQLCPKCRERQGASAELAPSFEPWMRDVGIHHWCQLCLKDLIRKPNLILDLRRRWEETFKRPTENSPSAQRRAKAYREGERFGRWEIYERDKGVCGLCGEPVDLGLSGWNAEGPTLDHLLPIAKGGKHTRANVQLAHRSCNSRKQARITQKAQAPKPLRGMARYVAAYTNHAEQLGAK